MARPGVTYLDIAQAATSLVEQGHYPSIEAVRHTLGTGSNGTISRYLKAWRDKQGNRLEAEQGLPETLLVTVKGLYDGIKEQATQQATVIEQETQQKLVELQKERDATTDAYQQLLKAHALLEIQVAAEKNNNEKLQKELVQRDQVIADDKAENHLLQVRLQDKLEEITRLSTQVLQAQENFEHYTQAVRTQRDEERQRVETHVKTLEIKGQQDQALIVQLQQTVAVQVKEIALLQEAKNQSNENFCKSQEALQALQSAFDTLKNQHAHLQNQQELTVNQYEKMTGEWRALSSRYQDLQANFTGNAERLRMTQAALQKTEDELVLLRDQQLFLTHEKTQLLAQREIDKG